ncbi:MAG: hypothetical protein QXO51_01420 [Halobacteria archaeon]
MPLTTVSLKPETLASLRAYKVGGASYDDVLNDLMDDHPPATFVQEHLRRLREEERSDWESAKRKLKV